MTDLEALALTIWGEARGEPAIGQQGVACVMRNRLLAHYRNAQTYVDVCTAHAQFSAWTDEAAQMYHEDTLMSHPDPVLQKCLALAQGVIDGTIPDNTSGANHYYADTIPTPFWAVHGIKLAHLGHHIFLNVA